MLGVHGHVDGLVHNAGVAVGGAVEEAELSRVRGVFETNFFGELVSLVLLC